MPHTIVLFNGLQLTDNAPGMVGRYKERRSGSWQSARLLMYVFPSFPRLWKPYSTHHRLDANNSAYQYRWTDWVSALENMRKESGAWAVLSGHLLGGQGPSHKDVADIAKAVIELALRDAEVERNSYKTNQRNLKTHWYVGGSSSSQKEEEQKNLMARVRRAITNNERNVEKCIYKALAYRDGSILQRIAQSAPSDNAVHSVIRGNRI